MHGLQPIWNFPINLHGVRLNTPAKIAVGNPICSSQNRAGFRLHRSLPAGPVSPRSSIRPTGTLRPGAVQPEVPWIGRHALKAAEEHVGAAQVDGGR